MNNSFGLLFRATTFGESHGAAIGVIIDGVPAGLPIDAADIQKELNRRRPGQSAVTTQRQESDCAEILSGVFEGVTTGTPLTAIIRNQDQRSRDYGNIAEVFRPGHADFCYENKFGIRDYRGGGRSSGRETAARVAAGAVAKKLLETYGIKITASTVQTGSVKAEKYCEDFIEQNIMRTADPDAAESMIAAVKTAMQQKDSIGGIVECRITGVPAGLGEPVFDKLDAELAKAVMSIGGVKGFEVGDGFGCAGAAGSVNNDAPGRDGWSSNHAGGILGGISNGADIIFRAAVKPTPSIARSQHTVDRHGNGIDIEIKGRHDPCLCPRIVVVVEAMAALVMADMLLRQRSRSNMAVH